MSDAIEWVDGHGRSRWQPITSDGKRLCRVSDYICGSYRAWRTQNEGLSLFPAFHDPVTFRSRARAMRVARRREARQRAKKMRTLQPAQKKETDA